MKVRDAVVEVCRQWATEVIFDDGAVAGAVIEDLIAEGYELDDDARELVTSAVNASLANIGESLQLRLLLALGDSP